MRLFRRDDPRKTRIEELKARVDSLRKADPAARPLTLNDFLAGDDVVAARDPLPDVGASQTAPLSAEDEEAAMLAGLERLQQAKASPEDRTQSFDAAVAAPREEPAAFRVSLEDFAGTPSAPEEADVAFDAEEPDYSDRAAEDDLAKALAQYLESLQNSPAQDSDGEPGEDELRDTI